MMNDARSTIDAPALDANELRWAAHEVASLMRQSEPGSVVCTVLQQTLRELASLKQSADGAVFDPMRSRHAA